MVITLNSYSDTDPHTLNDDPKQITRVKVYIKMYQ